jgi:hypothetical protein
MSYLTVSSRALIAVLALLTASCQRPDTEPTVDYHTWINPITGSRVVLPDGWRQSPETAATGETTVGFFAPSFAALMSRYGHITLHYEYLDDPSAPMTLDRLVDNFSTYMRHQSNVLGSPTFAARDSLETARLSLSTTHGQRELLLEVQFWTPDSRDYWYAVVEGEVEDPRFSEMAAPIVELLIDSTRPR